MAVNFVNAGFAEISVIIIWRKLQNLFNPFGVGIRFFIYRWFYRRLFTLQPFGLINFDKH